MRERTVLRRPDEKRRDEAETAWSWGRTAGLAASVAAPDTEATPEVAGPLTVHDIGRIGVYPSAGDGVVVQRQVSSAVADDAPAVAPAPAGDQQAGDPDGPVALDAPGGVPKPIQGPTFRTATTPYGTFHVYPDSYKGPMPVAKRDEGGWPIHEAAFAHLTKTIGAIAGGGKVRIDGPADFKAKVLGDFSWLLTQDAGQQLLDAIMASGKSLAIVDAGSAGNVTAALGKVADADRRPDGRPGPGCDAKMGYNPTEVNPFGGDEAWMTRPPAIGLAHELIHAWTIMTGNAATGTATEAGAEGGVHDVAKAEQQAIGLGDFSGATFTENKFRAAFGLPERPRFK